jgi:hypothetical protein
MTVLWLDRSLLLLPLNWLLNPTMYQHFFNLSMITGLPIVFGPALLPMLLRLRAVKFLA